MKHEMWGGSGISWTICKSFAPRSRQITTPATHHSIFYSLQLFLTRNQRCQSTEGLRWMWPLNWHLCILDSMQAGDLLNRPNRGLSSCHVSKWI